MVEPKNGMKRRLSQRRGEAAGQVTRRGMPSKGGAASASDGFPVIGIGASAGGLDTFRRLFDGLAADSGMAFVLIQHLDPTHRSLMVDLLGAQTAMTRQDAVDLK